MKTILEILNSAWAENFVLTLLHTLWEGFVLAFFLFLYLRFSNPQKMQRRYAVCLFFLLMVVFSGLVTFSILRPEPRNDAPAEAFQAPAAESSPLPADAVPIAVPAEVSRLYRIESMEQALHAAPRPQGYRWTGWALAAWAAGTAGMLIRLLGRLVDVSRLRKNSVEITDPVIQQVFVKIKDVLHIRRPIRLCKSTVIKAPGVIGCFRTVLLLPASMLTGVDTETLGVLFAHELMHVRRYDYLINFLQMLIESVLFFNPAIWWISRQIRIEREACCDAAGANLSGRPILYAEILYQWFVKISRENAANPAAAGFVRPQDGDIAERIRRIVQPEYRPRMKISWPGLIFPAVVCGSLFLVLNWTAQISVALAEQVLAPREAMKFMETIQNSPKDLIFRAVKMDSPEIPDEEKVLITGVIRTEDGKNIPPETRLDLNVHSPVTGGFGYRANKIIFNDPNGFFEQRINAGKFTAVIWGDGYAPFCVGPMDVKPGCKINFDVVLKKGFTGTVLFQDNSGVPVENAGFSGGFRTLQQGYTIPLIQVKSDSRGIIQIDHAVSYSPLTGRIRAEGYEEVLKAEIWLKEGEPSVVTLKRSPFLTGVVVDAQSRKPVPNAEIRIVFANNLKKELPWIDTEKFSCRSDKSGRFIFPTLLSGYTYDLQIKAENYGYQFAEGIHPGRSELEIPLHRQKKIEGTIRGNLQTLKKDNEKLYISYACRYAGAFQERSIGGFAGRVPVEVRDGIGYFEISKIWGNKIELTTGALSVAVPFDPNDIKPVILDFTEVNPDGAEYFLQPVTIAFEPKEQKPLPLGKTRLISIEDRADLIYVRVWTEEIVNGILQTDVPAPSTLYCRPDLTTGYSFSPTTPFSIKKQRQDSNLDIIIPAEPAGLIIGTLSGMDKVNKTDRIHLYCHSDSVARISCPYPNVFHLKTADNVNSQKGTIDYTITPAALANGYRIIASCGYAFVISDSFDLNADMPIRRMDIDFVEGQDLEIQCTDIAGDPIAGVIFDFSFRYKNFSIGRPNSQTNSKGNYTIQNLNPNLPGNYILSCKPDRDYQPFRKEITDFNSPCLVTLGPGAVLTGRLLDSKTGKPVPGAQVSANIRLKKEERDAVGYFPHLESEGLTDVDGNFRFSNLRPSCDYSITAIHIIPDQIPVITAGQTESIDIFISVP